MKRFLITLRKLYYRFLFHLSFYHSKWRNYTPAQEKLFNDIEPGDIVDAWMPMDEEELVKIPETHRHRPWYVIDKKNDCVMAYKGSSSIGYRSKDRCVFIPRKKYKVWKDGYAIVNRIYEVPINCLIWKIDHLHYKEMTEINRSASYVNNHSHQNLPLFDANVAVHKNDVVFAKGQLYWIYDASPVIRGTPVDRNPAGHNAYLKDGSHGFWFSTWNIVELDGGNVQSLYFVCKNQKVYSAKNEQYQKQKAKRKYRFPIGQLFVDPMTKSEYLYLYSKGGQDYGIRKNDYSGPHYVESIQCIDYDKAGLADDNTMTNIMNELIAADRKKYGWLNQFMVNEEESMRI